MDQGTSEALHKEPMEEERCLALCNGLILSNVLNKVNPGAVYKEDLIKEQELDVSPSNKKRKTTATTRKRRQGKLKFDGGIFLNVFKSSFDIQDLFLWR
ncbi:hypothetical protein OROHE_010624 [Orobanche hederae]